MKKLLFSFLLFSSQLSAQQGVITGKKAHITQQVTIGAASPVSSAWLQMGDNNTTKAMLLPRVASTGSVIAPVTEGMFVYTAGYPYWRDATAWRRALSTGDLNTITGCYGLISGGIVTWSGSGLIMDVSPARYVINCNYYQTVQSQVTLSAAHATLARLDVIAVDDASTVVVIAGTPAATPVKPQVNTATQVELTTILIPAAATTPGGITQTIIYNENTEWTSTSSLTAGTVDFNSTSTPFIGTKNAVLSSTATGNIFWTNGSQLNMGNYQALKLYVRLDASSSTHVIGAYLTLAGAYLTPGISLASYNYSNTIAGSYQVITIPMSDFQNSTGSVFDGVAFRLSAAGTTVHIDYVQLQGGLGTSGELTGAGTANYITKWVGSTALGNSIMYDNGTNVGIGTVSPSAKLHVNGAQQINGTLTILREAASAISIFNASGTQSIGTISRGNSAELSIQGVTTGLYLESGGSASAGVTINAVAAAPITLSTTNSERLRILSTGQVGIGVATPSARLHVLATTEQTRTGYDASNYVNTTVASNAATIYNAVGTLPSHTFSIGGTARAWVYNNSVANGYSFATSGDLGVGASVASGATLFFGSNYSFGTGDYIRHTAAGTLNFFGGGTTAATEHLVINAGNIGIGTATPAAKLSVGSSSDFQVNSSGKIAKYANSAITNGQLLLGSTSNGTFEKSTLTAGQNISISNGAGTVTIATDKTLDEGSYTPTLTNTTNIASSTAYTTYWYRVGDNITVYGKAEATTSSNVASELRMSLPVSTANFANEYEAGGVAAAGNLSVDRVNSAAIHAVVSNGVVKFV